jgi:DNA replication protein DnaC
MKAADPIDTARVELLLAEMRLPAVKQVWAALAAQSDEEGWPAARFLAALAEHEMAERTRRRIERHPAEARLPPGKTIDTFDFEGVPVVSKAQVMALAAGDAWPQPRRQSAAVWPARRRQEPSGRGSRVRAGRKRLARAVHPDH